MKTLTHIAHLFLIFVLLLVVQLSPVAHAGPEVPFPTVSMPALSQAVRARISRVPELAFIREQAGKMGIKVYLFGGTAAGFAHYVKWDLQREAGDARFQPDRFDYDFTNIYRSTQDLDVVVDGTAEQAATLQGLLKQTFAHVQGTKDQWEVRLLKTDMGDKQALLNNEDFLNQNTDSNSTGMIEVTESIDPVIRDLRDWDSVAPQFLRDVAEGKIHFYSSALHRTTSRYSQGKNPEIFSVIRFLTKAFQYELDIRDEDLPAIQKIIDDFKLSDLQQNPYAANWLEEHSKKLVRHAVNIEFAMNELDRLGLRQKLISIRNDTGRQQSLSWWLSREPLRSLPVGEGAGQTAQELGISVVAHETNEYVAIESITRAHTGDPNVLISRKQREGEAAAFGDGFYTQKGRVGARGTGLTIRFRVDPMAREGTDFIVSGSYVIFRNKHALRVIPETLNVSYLSFLNMLGDLDASDRGMIEKLRRRFNNRQNILSANELDAIASFVVSRVPSVQTRTQTVDPVIAEWLSSRLSDLRPQVVAQLIDRNYASLDILRVLPNFAPQALNIAMEKLSQIRENVLRGALQHHLLGQGNLLPASWIENQFLKNPNTDRWLRSIFTDQELEQFAKALPASAMLLPNSPLMDRVLPSGQTFRDAYFRNFISKSFRPGDGFSNQHVIHFLTGKVQRRDPQYLDLFLTVLHKTGRILPQESTQLVSLVGELASSDATLARLFKLHSQLMSSAEWNGVSTPAYMSALAQAIKSHPNYFNQKWKILEFISAPPIARYQTEYQKAVTTVLADSLDLTKDERWRLDLLLINSPATTLSSGIALRVLERPLGETPSDVMRRVFELVPAGFTTSEESENLQRKTIEFVLNAQVTEETRASWMSGLISSGVSRNKAVNAIDSRSAPLRQIMLRNFLLSDKETLQDVAMKFLITSGPDHAFIRRVLLKEIADGRPLARADHPIANGHFDRFTRMKAWIAYNAFSKARDLDLLQKLIGITAGLDMMIISKLSRQLSFYEHPELGEAIIKNLNSADPNYWRQTTREALRIELLNMFIVSEHSARHPHWVQLLRDRGPLNANEQTYVDRALLMLSRNGPKLCMSVFNAK